MREYVISAGEAQQRLDKYLGRLLPAAPKSFLYKMLRKKNITLNKARATGPEILKEGDTVRIYFSEETFASFSEQAPLKAAYGPLEVLYEDEDLCLINKPAGMLSQMDASGEPSAVEYLIGHLICTGRLKEGEKALVRPSVANRLDRNTSGIIAAGKSLPGLQMLSEHFRNRTLKKEYLALVRGCIESGGEIEGWLTKDEARNQVSLTKEEREGASYAFTGYAPVLRGESFTLLKVDLHTGKTHQIRASLASIGHPLVGDEKYGDQDLNLLFRKKYKLCHQLLHASRLTFPVMEGHFEYLSGQCFEAPLPELFVRVLEGEKIRVSNR